VTTGSSVFSTLLFHQLIPPREVLRSNLAPDRQYQRTTTTSTEVDCTDILYVPKVIVPILTFNVPKLDVQKKRTESIILCTEIVLYRKRPTPFNAVFR